MSMDEARRIVALEDRFAVQERALNQALTELSELRAATKGLPDRLAAVEEEIALLVLVKQNTGPAIGDVGAGRPRGPAPSKAPTNAASPSPQAARAA